ncbi:MAG: extracellular solute-binding protein [Treponema sp.]|jgi:putative aldouronate transport system substrate-binding protein|nr:extracellular solute-binding protein [Treponema sp.]
MKKIMAVLVILIMTTALVFAAGSSSTTTTGAVSIRVETFDRGTDGGRTNAANNAWTQWIQEKVKRDLNIDVTFVAVGRWSETTDLPNLLASNTAPDLCYTYDGGMISNFRDRGGILNIQPYMERLLPDMKKLLGPDPALTGKDFIYRQLDPQGRVFSIPSYRVALAQRNVFIRKDWLDTLGMALPTTIQQFHDALVAFRTRDPGRVGAANIIPLMQDNDTRWGLANFMHGSIPANITDKDRYINSVADRNLLMPNYKEGVRLMNTWYNEGLIYRDFALMTTGTDDFYNVLKSGMAGAFSANWDIPFRTDYSINTDLARNVPGASFVPVDVGTKDMMDKAGLQIFVPSASTPRAEAALRYLNWLCIQENYSYLQIGQPGVNHNMVNGVPQTIAATGPWIQNSGNNIDLTMPMNGVERGSAAANAAVLALSYAGIPPETIVNAYDIATRNARAPVVVNMPTSQDGIYGADLRQKADDLLAQAIAATPANFDRIWDAGIQDWLRSGAQAILDERTTIANAWRW